MPLWTFGDIARDVDQHLKITANKTQMCEQAAEVCYIFFFVK